MSQVDDPWRCQMRDAWLGRLCAVVAATALLMQPLAAAQFSSSSPDDLASLERRVADARAKIASAPATLNAAEQRRLEGELDEIADDITYLRVKSRRGESVSAQDRRQVGERLGRLEARLANTASADSSTIPVGTEIDVRLQTPLSSETAQVEQRVDATTVMPLQRGSEIAIPAGTPVVGHVVAVDRATRTDRKGSLVVQFTRMTIGGRDHDVRLSITQALESEGIRGEAGRIGVGAGVGAIIGGILGGLKGAITGILIGGGGTIVATEGEDVELPVGTILRVRFDTALDLGR
jgi:hypothetical protein